MVRVLKRWPAHELHRGRRKAAQRVDGRDLHRLMVAKVRQEAGQPLRQHRLAGSRRPGKEQVMGGRRSHLQGPARLSLSGDICHVGTHGREGQAVTRVVGLVRFEVQGKFLWISPKVEGKPGKRTVTAYRGTGD